MRRNDQLVKGLDAFFVRKADPATAWAAAIDTFLMLPGLRGFWPMSSVDNSGNALDLSGQGRTLTYNGNPLYNLVGLAPYINFDGTGDYLSRADEAGLDVIGNESYLATALRGMTVGGWFWFDIATASEGLITHAEAAGANAAFWLRHRGDVAGDPIRFSVYSGITAYTAIGANTSISQWYWCVGRYTPSVDVDIFVQDVKGTPAGSAPATINNSTAAFNISGWNSGTNLLDGRASLCFLCATALPDSVIRGLYHKTRALFGVR